LVQARWREPSEVACKFLVMATSTENFFERATKELLTPRSDQRQRRLCCHVEALALRIKEGEGAFIRVKDNNGQTVIRAGVTTAVASIAKCSYGACPLKELKRRGSFGNREVAEPGGHLPPCERRAGKP
jgi:hypothetical protein